MICPECHKNLGKSIEDTIDRVGWCCVKCKIKVYKEKEIRV